jgi:GNAT superfamily N-acetyltransferase
VTWTITSVPVTDPIAVAMQREYLTDIIDRYYGRPALESDVDDAMADDPVEHVAAFLLASYDGELAGCAGVGVLEPGVAELKRLYVRKAFRGRGGGAALPAAVERQARAARLGTIRLDTRADLVEARALYARHGYTEIGAYNDSPYAEHWFEKVIG